MSKILEFKTFVKNNPKLISYVKNNATSWQKLYEIYDLYGEDKNIWNEYLKDSNDTLEWLKKINLEGLQNGISNIQKVLGMVQELTKKEEVKKEEYKPRPIYKHFED